MTNKTSLSDKIRTSFSSEDDDDILYISDVKQAINEVLEAMKELSFSIKDSLHTVVLTRDIIWLLEDKFGDKLMEEWK